MRILIALACVATGITVLYKWRYRLLTMFLAFCVLRKALAILKMNMQTVKKKILLKIGDKTENTAEN